jgi:hypothetical protein
MLGLEVKVTALSAELLDSATLLQGIKPTELTEK